MREATSHSVAPSQWAAADLGPLTPPPSPHGHTRSFLSGNGPSGFPFPSGVDLQPGWRWVVGMNGEE